jgi:hypothetical protein
MQESPEWQRLLGEGPNPAAQLGLATLQQVAEQGGLPHDQLAIARELIADLGPRCDMSAQALAGALLIVLGRARGLRVSPWKAEGMVRLVGRKVSGPTVGVALKRCCAHWEVRSAAADSWSVRAQPLRTLFAGRQGRGAALTLASTRPHAPSMRCRQGQSAMSAHCPKGAACSTPLPAALAGSTQPAA